MIIDTTFAQAHPIHLHGHDFYVLGTGSGTYDNTTTTFNTTNPPRRDVAMLPANGWLALAWYTDNPGAWIMHCKSESELPIFTRDGPGLALTVTHFRPHCLARGRGFRAPAD